MQTTKQLIDWHIRVYFFNQTGLKSVCHAETVHDLNQTRPCLNNHWCRRPGFRFESVGSQGQAGCFVSDKADALLSLHKSMQKGSTRPTHSSIHP